MKHFVFFISMLVTAAGFAAPGIHEALKNPSAAASLKLSGENNEAALLVKNHSLFTSLSEITIFGITDSLLAEQDIAAIASCAGVKKIKFESCGFRNFSGALKMLSQVITINITGCNNLRTDQSFEMIAGMPAVREFELSVNALSKIPVSFNRLRFLHKISISNTDISLADGFALNTQSPGELFTAETTSLGFGNDILELNYSCYDKASAKTHLGMMRDLLQGAVGANGEIILPQRPKAFERNHPLVKEPIAGLEVHKNIYSANAVRGGEIEYPSGTKIEIPENAFVDKDGNTLKGEVTIDYREFRDPVDIMVSGIPMDYDSGGVNGHFVSAGMFEMNASVNGQEVFLAPGKNVSMKFAVVDTAADFNFYRLDEKKGWVYETSPGKVETSNSFGQASQAGAIAFSNALNSWYDWLQQRQRLLDNMADGKYDTLDFDARYEDERYHYLWRGGKKEFTVDEQYFHSDFVRLEKTYHHRGTVCFKLKRDGYSSNDPEINAFGGVNWETTDNLRTAQIKRLFREKSGIWDMRIYPNGGGYYLLEFKTAKGKIAISAKPTWLRKGKTPREYGEKAMASMERHYNRTLNKRKNKFNTELQENLANDNEESKQRRAEILMDSTDYWKKLQPRMNAGEKAMDYEGWMSYYKEKLPAITKAKQVDDYAYGQVTSGADGDAQVQAEAMYQELKISGFGIYNCDHCGSLPAPIAKNAEISVPGFTKVIPSNIYVIDRDINTSTTFHNSGGKETSITYNKGSRTSLIIIDSEGRLFYTDTDDFASGENVSGNTRYPAKIITDIPGSPEQIRELLKAAK